MSIVEAVFQPSIRGTIHSIDASASTISVELSNGDHETVTVAPSSSILKIGWKGASVVVLDDNERHCILEPEHLVDVTTVTECITGGTSLPALATLRKFEPRSTNVYATQGNLVNSVVDLLVADGSRSDDDLLTTSMNERPLTWAALHANGENVAAMEQGARDLLPHIRDVIGSWSSDKVVVEPYVTSSLLGLQGRFDILISREDGDHLIELKAGKAPNGIRANHAAQVAAYELLYAAAFGRQLASSSVWYAAAHAIRPLSSTQIHGIVEQGPIEALHHRIIETRNYIVANEHAIAQRQFGVLKTFNGRSLAASGPAGAFEQEFHHVYSNATMLARTYSQVWTSFSAAESAAIKSGDSQRNTSVRVDNLAVDAAASDASTMHIVLTSNHEIGDTSLRAGDLVIMYRVTKRASAGSTLIKAWIIEVESASITVSFRNKQFDWDEIISGTWTVEQDATDMGLRSLVSNTFQVLQSPLSTQELILGTREPRFGSQPTIDADDLTDTQREIVTRACSAQDYFLIQGPPGTGKTSRVLKNIVSTLHRDPNERLLVLAYTNRAVDEICSVLERALPHGSFLRHGSKAGSKTFRHLSTYAAADGASWSELSDALTSVRCIVSTIQTANTGTELFSFGQFTTLVVDEASQILEPYLLGVMSSIKRSILIGDQAQLPPIVVQPQEQLEAQADIFNDIQLTYIGRSLFERLFLVSRSNGWTDAYATLVEQGRMHNDIARLVSNQFYSGQLLPADEWQTSTEPTPWHSVLDTRTAFIPVDGSSSEEQRQLEVESVVSLVTKFLGTTPSGAPHPTIGVITPFRAQNRAMQQGLPEGLREHVTVDTVERFQGSQRDIIIFSASIFDENEFRTITSEINFDGKMIDRKLNVACSRAREQLVLVGKEAVLMTSPAYRQILSAIRILT